MSATAPGTSGPKPKVLKTRPPVPRGTPVGTSTDPLANTGIVGAGQQRARPANPPAYAESDPESVNGNLDIDINGNLQSYVYDINLGLTRFAADGSQNNCWFDAFLFTSSDFYRTQSLSKRQELAKSLREWCKDHSDVIVNNFPQEFRDLPGFDDFNTGAKLRSELQGMKELESLAGFIIAWYFRLNLVLVNAPGPTSTSRGYELNCFTNIQNEDCQCIVMLYTGNHFEPLVFYNDENNDTKGKFKWTNPDLCKIRDLSANCDSNEDFQDVLQDSTIRSWFGHWTRPNCEEVNFGGRRRTRKRRVKRKSKNKQSRRYRR